jgi:predicted alpha/beta superfamily hydrolase
MNVKNYVIFLIVLIAINGKAQQKFYVWPNTSIQKIISSEINDTFQLYVKLPNSYFNSSKSYPLLVVLDGDLLFPIAASVSQYLEYGAHVPEMIIVGIGYGTLDWQNGNTRSRDFTAHSSKGREHQGGAPDFLSFVKMELLPKLLNSYRIDTQHKILMGHSLGGQFSLYTWINQPSLFSSYIASSPAIFRWSDYYWAQLEKNQKQINDSPKYLFISHGELEDKKIYHEVIEELIIRINKADLTNTRLNFLELENTDHFMAPASALIQGLKHYFNP